MVEINEMNLSVPGKEKSQGEELARAITNQLANKLPVQMADHHIDTLNIQLSLPAEASQTEIAETIVHRILMELNIS